MDIDMILGPPGTGKTKTLEDIVDFELNKKGVAPENIALVTFTKKGAEELLSRVSARFGIPMTSFKNARTLHSMAFRGVGAKRDNMMNRARYYDFSKKIGMSFSGYYSEELSNGDDKYLFLADMYRNNKKYAIKQSEPLDRNKLMFVMKQYRQYKDTFLYTDFTDLIEMFINRKVVIDAEVAIIDEAQDLTTLQWQMVWSAFSGCKRVYIAGDDDQAIYQWSGADVNYFLNIQGNIQILKESWRLPQTLVNYSKKISTQIDNRIDKTYHGQNKPGGVQYVNSLAEIDVNPKESYLCLSRNNCFLPQYEEWLTSLTIPYKFKGENVVSKMDLEAIKKYENVRKTSMMSDVLEHKLSRLRKKDSTLADPWYDAFDWPENKILLIRDLIGQKRVTEESKINVATIHSVKGGEADNVILMEDITKPVYAQLDLDPDSEHRVFYVGATRAKKNLIIVKAQSEFRYKL